MGGDVSVKSELGVGSTFTVTLRIPKAEGATSEGPTDLLELAPEARATSARTRKALRILMCEDDPMNRKVLNAMLKRLGHETVIVEDGNAAWAAIRAEDFDLLITDVEMPGLDGLSLARRIREFELGRGVRLPIIGATAHVGQEHRHLLLDAGMDAHLPKPFVLDELTAVIESVSA
jgi:CheY-like chemotaxis protein